MSELNKSDHMLFINEAYLQYKDMKDNDLLFRQQFSRNHPRCPKEIDAESQMRLMRSAKVLVCDKMLTTRGGNANGCKLIDSCPTSGCKKVLNIMTKPRNSFSLCASSCH